jgi:SET domain-containing protein
LNAPNDVASNACPPQTELVIFASSRIHGLGGFAKTGIPEGRRLMQYVGEIIDKQESLCRCEQNNVYLFALNERHDIDGNVPWNPARYLNHSCSPNCEAEVDEDQIWIVAARDIRAGEELTFNYGFDLESYRDYLCCCGSPNCVGFIIAEEFFDHVRNQNEIGASPT